MKVFFRSLEDGSTVVLERVARFTVLEDRYLITFLPNFSPMLVPYLFRFYSLLGVSHEDL